MLSKKSLFHNLYYVKELLILICIIYYVLQIKGFIYVSYGIIVLIIIILFFFRNNLTLPKVSVGDILSPSCSKVISVDTENNRKRIFTYLSPLDKHFVIAPVECSIKRIYRKLYKDDQERLIFELVDNKNKKFAIHLIVKKLFKGIGVLGGWMLKIFYSNRIVSFCKRGQKLKQGERLGLIRFGSNMEYFFPKSYKLNMKVDKHIDIGKKIGKQ